LDSNWNYNHHIAIDNYRNYCQKYFKKNYFEICGLLAGASTDPPALAFALKIAGNDIPSATYALCIRLQ
jgi:uncharacterized transporter YbjL